MTSVPVLAYNLPACSISDEERGKPAENILLGYRAERRDLAKLADIVRLDEHKRNPKIRLAARERKAAKKYEALIVKIRFWEEVEHLKGALLALHGASPPTEAALEADAIAKNVIETLHALSQKWRIGSSALFANFLINIGLKENGFCYHYVAMLRKALSKQVWSQFEIRWGTTWENTFRENNALVITAKGRPFEDGLAIDAWRSAGRPFWTPVKEDRFPWIEEWDVETKYEVE